MSELNNLKLEIKKIFFNVFPNLKEGDFDWEKHQSGYDDWDSFAQMQLITATESKFNIKISPEEAISIQSAESLLTAVKSKI